MKKMSSSNVVCPYYKFEERQKIFCEGVERNTANDVFHIGPGRAALFERTYSNNYANLCRLLMDDEGDPELTYSTSDIDRRLRSIVGEENFVPWDERYGDVTQ